MERLHPVVAGIITALVGFTSSFAVVLAGLRSAGATQHQAASGLLVVSVLMGLLAIALSRAFRMPISIAWSTPGAALLITSGRPSGGFGAAVTAFGVCGALLALTGLVPSLRRLVTAIPVPIASALLAGVLFELCIVPVHTVRDHPALAVPIVLSWLVMVRLAPRWAVPVSMAVALTEILLRAGGRAGGALTTLSRPELVMPQLSLGAVTLGLSLYVVTMASQNIPGIAVLKEFGYRAPLRAVFTATGLTTLAGAALGGHVLNLAAISAALCAGPDAHRDPAQRWRASSVAGLCYVLFGLGAGALSAIVALAPAGLVETVAGLALLTTLGSALSGTVSVIGTAPAWQRQAAVITFVVTTSGLAFGGIGSAFWGLAAGLAVTAVLGAAVPVRAAARD